MADDDDKRPYPQHVNALYKCRQRIESTQGPDFHQLANQKISFIKKLLFSCRVQKRSVLSVRLPSIVNFLFGKRVSTELIGVRGTMNIFSLRFVFFPPVCHTACGLLREALLHTMIYMCG